MRSNDSANDVPVNNRVNERVSFLCKHKKWGNETNGVSKETHQSSPSVLRDRHAAMERPKGCENAGNRASRKNDPHKRIETEAPSGAAPQASLLPAEDDAIGWIDDIAQLPQLGVHEIRLSVDDHRRQDPSGNPLGCSMFVHKHWGEGNKTSMS